MQGFENGAGTAATITANVAAFSEVAFRPRGGISVERRDLRTTILGHEIDLPVLASSIGQLGLAHPDAEPGVARAIGAAGSIQFVSGFTSTPIETIMAVASGPVYYQLYYFGRDPSAIAAIVERVRRAGCAGLVLNIDSAAPQTPVRQRLYPERRRKPSSTRPADAIRFLPQLLPRPAWALDYARGRVRVATPMALGPDGTSIDTFRAFTAMYDRAFAWTDLTWIREVWDCPIVIKGVMGVDDARRAVDVGAAGLVVSNHGGNRLDGTMASLRVLPEVVDAVGGELSILFDSGVRRGTDVVKALALGAEAVLLGRAYLYPLIAAGEDGVRRILQLFRQEIDGTLAHLGCSSIAELGPHHLELPERYVVRGRTSIHPPVRE
jgi:isopentenyl diphosphate isomerase/L-lactate dehydrogenase-like FMN-dependent dehydrogenase